MRSIPQIETPVYTKLQAGRSGQSEELAISICTLSERVRFALFRQPRYNKVSHRTRSIRPVYLRKALWLLEQSGILRMVAT